MWWLASWEAFFVILFLPYRSSQKFACCSQKTWIIWDGRERPTPMFVSNHIVSDTWTIWVSIMRIGRTLLNLWRHSTPEQTETKVQCVVESNNNLLAVTLSRVNVWSVSLLIGNLVPMLNYTVVCMSCEKSVYKLHLWVILPVVLVTRPSVHHKRQFYLGCATTIRKGEEMEAALYRYVFQGLPIPGVTSDLVWLGGRQMWLRVFVLTSACVCYAHVVDVHFEWEGKAVLKQSCFVNERHANFCDDPVPPLRCSTAILFSSCF